MESTAFLPATEHAEWLELTIESVELGHIHNLGTSKCTSPANSFTLSSTLQSPNFNLDSTQLEKKGKTVAKPSNNNPHKNKKWSNIIDVNVLNIQAPLFLSILSSYISRLEPVYEAAELVAPKPKWIKHGLPDILDCSVNNASRQRDCERPEMWMPDFARLLHKINPYIYIYGFFYVKKKKIYKYIYIQGLMRECYKGRTLRLETQCALDLTVLKFMLTLWSLI